MARCEKNPHWILHPTSTPTPFLFQSLSPLWKNRHLWRLNWPEKTSWPSPHPNPFDCTINLQHPNTHGQMSTHACTHTHLHAHAHTSVMPHSHVHSIHLLLFSTNYSCLRLCRENKKHARRTRPCIIKQSRYVKEITSETYFSPLCAPAPLFIFQPPLIFSAVCAHPQKKNIGFGHPSSNEMYYCHAIRRKW